MFLYLNLNIFNSTNNLINSFKNVNNNSFNKNKSFSNYETYTSRNNNNIKNKNNSKYFLKSIFDQNITNNFAKTFSPFRKNKKIIFSSFDFNSQSKEKENQFYFSPKKFFNIERNENRLKQILKSVPTHKNEKKINEINKIFSQILNNYSNFSNNIHKLTLGEIYSIMPPNLMANEKSND